jgi:DNA-binding IscR family transcriptional regulator
LEKKPADINLLAISSTTEGVIMKFNFKSQKAESADAPKPEKRDSLAAFKAKADAVLAEDTLNKITGGRFSDCHCHCHSASAL